LNAVIKTPTNAAGDDYLLGDTNCDLTTTAAAAAPAAPAGPPAGVSGASSLDVKLTSMISFLVLAYLALAM
jgi:hypothetical protein